MTPSLETILTEIADAGFLVNNLFQRDGGYWQANLRSSSGHTAFAYGTTAAEALALTLNLLEEVEPFPKVDLPKVYTGSYIETDNKIKADLRSVLANLLPKQKMVRRL